MILTAAVMESSFLLVMPLLKTHGTDGTET
jgi:hypothetical protein